MPIVPSNVGKDNPASLTKEEVATLARDKIRVALSVYFKGKNAKQRLEDAVNASVASIVNLLAKKDGNANKLGVTVMTRASSMKNPVTGEFNKPPRNL